MRGRNLEEGYEEVVWDSAVLLYRYLTHLNESSEATKTLVDSIGRDSGGVTNTDKLINWYKTHSGLYIAYQKKSESEFFVRSVPNFSRFVREELQPYSLMKRRMMNLVHNLLLDLITNKRVNFKLFADLSAKDKGKVLNLCMSYDLKDGVDRGEYDGVGIQWRGVPNEFERYVSYHEFQKLVLPLDQSIREEEVEGYPEKHLQESLVRYDYDVDDNGYAVINYGNKQTIKYDFFVDWSHTDRHLYEAFKEWLKERRPDGREYKAVQRRDSESMFHHNLTDFRLWHIEGVNLRSADRVALVNKEFLEARRENAIRNSANNARKFLELCVFCPHHVTRDGQFR